LRVLRLRRCLAALSPIGLNGGANYAGKKRFLGEILNPVKTIAASAVVLYHHQPGRAKSHAAYHQPEQQPGFVGDTAPVVVKKVEDFADCHESAKNEKHQEEEHQEGVDVAGIEAIFHAHDVEIGQYGHPGEQESGHGQ
jgi:hypothetical protein